MLLILAGTVGSFVGKQPFCKFKSSMSCGYLLRFHELDLISIMLLSTITAPIIWYSIVMLHMNIRASMLLYVYTSVNTITCTTL